MNHRMLLALCIVYQVLKSLCSDECWFTNYVDMVSTWHPLYFLLKPSSHYMTLHVGRSLCFSDYMTWLSLFKSLWRSHYMTLCKWSATRGYTLHELTTTLSPNDSIRTLNHVCHENTRELTICKELDLQAIWPIRTRILCAAILPDSYGQSS